ncbi:unnamed protein product [Arctogadus glacialis]
MNDDVFFPPHFLQKTISPTSSAWKIVNKINSSMMAGGVGRWGFITGTERQDGGGGEIFISVTERQGGGAGQNFQTACNRPLKNKSRLRTSRIPQLNVHGK